MTSKSKLSTLFKGKSVHDLPTYTTPITKHEWTKNDSKLMEAVEKQNVKKVQSLLSKKNLNPTKRGPLGRSAFHTACLGGNREILDILLPCALDVNVTTIQGSTALQYAASKGHSYTVEKLLEKSANVNQRDSNEMTALHHACAGPHLGSVKVLLSGNADPHAKELSGKTALVYAAHRGDLDICRCLLERGADINSQDRDHVTALMLAAKAGHAHICEYLLSQGANTDLKDGSGNTVMKYATSPSVQEKLLAQAAKPAKVQEEKNTQMEKRVKQSGLESSSPEVSENSIPSPKPVPALRTNHNFEKVYQTLKVEHEQLNEDYSALARENLKLRDKFQSSQQKLTELREKMNVEEEEYKVPGTEVKNLKEELELEKQRNQPGTEAVEKVGITGALTSSRADDVKGSEDRTDGISDVEVSKKDHNLQTELLERLREQVISLEDENTRLKLVAQDGDIHKRETTPINQDSDAPENVKANSAEISATLESDLRAEICELKKSLEHQTLASSSASVEAQQQKEHLQQRNAALECEMGEVKAEVLSLQKALEEAKLENTANEAQRLDALLERSKNIEDVNFDEEGFVEGRDMTKEEFLQGQNQQLRTQCDLLSQELEKLRTTFDAILKAGDNLQADYDQQASEKEALQYDLDLSLKEKSELASENEFLLQDNNELHDSLRQLVHELERMQDKLQAAQAAQASVQAQIAAQAQQANPELEAERDALQSRCSELEATVVELQGEHNTMIKESQDLAVTIQQVTAERDGLAAQLSELELMCRQQEGLQQEYNQLEVDFAELLREKQSLELRVAQSDAEGSSTESSAPAYRLEDYRQLEKEKLELEAEISKLSKTQADQVGKLSNHEKSAGQSLPNGDHENLRNTQDPEGNNNNVDDSQKQVVSLKKQVAKLCGEIEDWERRYTDTVNTYRTHLLSAVQGHMDPDVKDALYQIIELRSMEQFC